MTEKLRQCERFVSHLRCKSPIIYAYAAKICRENPDEIRRTGEFWIQLLSYMLRYSCLTAALAKQYLTLPLAGIENAQLYIM